VRPAYDVPRLALRAAVTHTEGLALGALAGGRGALRDVSELPRARYAEAVAVAAAEAEQVPVVVDGGRLGAVDPRARHAGLCVALRGELALPFLPSIFLPPRLHGGEALGPVLPVPLDDGPDVLRLHDARRPANGAVETEPRALACQGIAIAALHVRDRGGVAARHVADDLPHAGGAEGVVVGAHDLAVVVDGVVANRALGTNTRRERDARRAGERDDIWGAQGAKSRQSLPILCACVRASERASREATSVGRPSAPARSSH